MAKAVRVGRVSEFRVGRGRQVDVGGTKVAVFRTSDRFVALDDTCPHMGASLADGRLLGNEVQCSWHEWRYDLETGRSPVRPWACVRVWAVRIDGDDVWVEPPEPTPAPDPAAETDDPEWMSWDPGRYFKRKDDAER